MTVRRVAARSLSLLALTGPLAASLLLAAAPAAYAGGSITAPGASAVISSGSSFAARATVTANSEATTLTLAGPGYSSSKSVAKDILNGQNIEIAVSTGNGASIRNGQWTVTLSGGASDTSTFFTNFAPATPGGFSAQGSGARDVSFTWTKGSEPDLSGYALYDDNGTVIDGDINLSVCSRNYCSYGLYYPSDNAGSHTYRLAAKRPGGGCGSCASVLESTNRASASATLVNPPPPPPPSPSPSPSPTEQPGGTTGGSSTGGSSTGGSTGGSSTGGSAGGSTGGSSTGGPTGGSSTGGSSTSGSTTGGTAVKPGAKPTLPTFADPILASRRAFALQFSAFSPSLGIPKLPPLPAITMPSFNGEAPLPEGSYNPQLPYQPQTEVDVERTTSFAGRPIAQFRDAIDSAQLAKSLAAAFILLLVGAHLRRYLGTHAEE